MARSRFMPALNRATAGAGLSIEDYIVLAATAGYQWIELDGAQVPDLFALGQARAAGLLAQHGLRIASFFLPVDWRHEEERFAADMATFAAFVPFMAALGTRRCCTYLFPNLPTAPEESRRQIGRRFALVDALLADNGLRFGLEFLGPAHFLLEPGHTFLYRMQDMLAFAESIGPNVGVLIDSLHWHCLGADRDALAALPPNRVIYAHIDDAPAGPVAAQRDDDRLLPGEGVIDLIGFIEALASAGYSGPIGIEIDGPYLRADSPERAAARAFAAWNALFARPEFARFAGGAPRNSAR
jgi:sugar phosphate isomerase/epimerase